MVGAQGEKGEQGEKGAQGNAGEKGDAGGSPGAAAAGDTLMCFSTTMPLGEQTAYMGYGSHADEHIIASIILPFDAVVVGFMAKATQGTTRVSGSAQLFGDGGAIVGVDCNLQKQQGQTSCSATPGSLMDVALDAGDNLSVRIIASGGDFRSAGACLVLE
jgi:hypothetical protein